VKQDHFARKLACNGRYQRRGLAGTKRKINGIEDAAETDHGRSFRDETRKDGTITNLLKEKHLKTRLALQLGEVTQLAAPKSAGCVCGSR